MRRSRLRWRQPRRLDEARRRWLRDGRTILRECGFDVYGLDERWTGSRWFGGSGASDVVITRVDLGHGDALDDDAPLVRVETSTSRGHDERQVARTLAQHLWRDGAEHELVRRAFTDADPTASWTPLVLDVDGRRVTMRSLSAAATWVAFGPVGGTLVAVTARNVDPAEVGLARVRDADRYANPTM